MRSEWCSSYSSCSTASDSCTTNWPWWGGVNGDGWGGYWGGKGSNGVFTVTVTSGQASVRFISFPVTDYNFRPAAHKLWILELWKDLLNIWVGSHHENRHSDNDGKR